MSGGNHEAYRSVHCRSCCSFRLVQGETEMIKDSGPRCSDKVCLPPMKLLWVQKGMKGKYLVIWRCPGCGNYRVEEV